MTSGCVFLLLVHLLLWLYAYRGSAELRSDNISVVAGKNATDYSGGNVQTISAVLHNRLAIVPQATGQTQPTGQPSRQPTTHPSSKPSTLPTPNYYISVIAGTGVMSYSGNNVSGTSAALHCPYGMAVDKTDSYIYFADLGNFLIRKVSLRSGIISNFAGTTSSNSCGFSSGAALTSTSIGQPTSVKGDSSMEYLYIDNWSCSVILRVSMSTNIITIYAGSSGSSGSSGDGGPATSALLSYPRNFAIDSNNNMYIADSSNNKIRKVEYSSSKISTFAGTGSTGYSGDLGFATSAALTYPCGVAVDMKNTYVFISDSSNNVIRRVSLSTNIIETIAGTGTQGFSGNGIAAIKATLNSPQGLSFDGKGNLYFADTSNNRIRKIAVSSNYEITTFAGSGQGSGATANVFATAAKINGPTDVTVDSNDNVYISECQGEYVRKVIINLTPSSQPTSQPSRQPSMQPTMQPNVQPSSLPSSQPSSKPSRQPSSRPSSSPTCGTGSQASNLGCSKCAAGKYSSTVNSNMCTDCPMGTFTDADGFSLCKACPGITYTNKPGSSSCEAYYINALRVAYISLFVIASVSYSSLLVYSSELKSMQSLLTTIAFSAIPFLDIYSDLLYIMTTEFYNLPLLICIVFVFSFANCSFAYDLLYIRRAFPVIQQFPGYYLVGSTMVFLSHDSGRPLVNGQSHAWSYQNHDSIDKILQFYLLWIYLIILQILYIMLLFPLWIVVYSIFLVFWFVLGLFLFQTKLIALGKLRNMWFSNWAQSDSFNIDLSVDVGLLHQSTFYQFMLETAPQLLLQTINSFMTRTIFKSSTIFSITFSFLITVQGIYRFGYYLFWKGIRFEDIPLPLALKVTQVTKDVTRFNIKKAILNLLKGETIFFSANSRCASTIDRVRRRIEKSVDDPVTALYLNLLVIDDDRIDALFESLRGGGPAALKSEDLLTRAFGIITGDKARSTLSDEHYTDVVNTIFSIARTMGYADLVSSDNKSLAATIDVADNVYEDNYQSDRGITMAHKRQEEWEFYQKNPMHRT